MAYNLRNARVPMGRTTATLASKLAKKGGQVVQQIQVSTQTDTTIIPEPSIKNISRSRRSSTMSTPKKQPTSKCEASVLPRKKREPTVKQEPKAEGSVSVSVKGESGGASLKTSEWESYVKRSKVKRSPTKRDHIKIEYEEELQSIPKVEDGVWAPHNWEKHLVNIRRMRSGYDAPVDEMGCDKISDQQAKPNDYRYQVLLSLLLSSQTKDEVTSAAVGRLRDHGCSVENILATSDDQLGRLIHPVGFWKSKVKYIRKTSEILRDKYDCDVPSTVKELIALPDLCYLAEIWDCTSDHSKRSVVLTKHQSHHSFIYNTGIGPKMAHLIMQCAWNKTTGIAVDTHVYRITQRLGWMQKPPKQPEDTRKALESWLPKSLWSEINWLLVGFGQQMCGAINPHCSECLNRDICTVPNKKIKKEMK